MARVGFDFAKAFGCPVQLMNDAAMQALGSYKGGRMLFLGLGTGFGSSLIVEGIVVPMEWGHFSYRNGTIEDYLGARALKRLGKKRWSRHFKRVITFINEVFHADNIVIGGGNARKLRNLPPVCRIGCNADAFVCFDISPSTKTSRMRNRFYADKRVSVGATFH